MKDLQKILQLNILKKDRCVIKVFDEITNRKSLFYKLKKDLFTLESKVGLKQAVTMIH